MAISTYAATLKIGSTSYAIKNFPDLYGEPNLLETTTLSNDSQTFITGIKQMSTMSFTLNYDKTEFNTLKDDERTAGKSFEVAFSDGSKFTWTGMYTLGIPSKGVDEVIEYQIHSAPSTDITFTAGS